MTCKWCGLEIVKGSEAMIGSWYHPTKTGNYTFCANATRSLPTRGLMATPHIELDVVNNVLNKYLNEV